MKKGGRFHQCEQCGEVSGAKLTGRIDRPRVDRNKLNDTY